MNSRGYMPRVVFRLENGKTGDKIDSNETVQSGERVGCGAIDAAFTSLQSWLLSHHKFHDDGLHVGHRTVTARQPSQRT